MTMTTRRRAAGPTTIATLLGLSTVNPHAGAQEADASAVEVAGAEEAALDVAAEADILFELGVEAQRTANYRGALQHYLASQRLAPNKNVVFNIAVCFERLQRWTDAFRYYDAYSREDLTPEDRTLVEDALRRVRPRVALLRVTSDPPGATVYIDRRDLGARGRTPITLPVDPSSAHRVVLELEGYEGAESDERSIAVGQESTVEVPLVRILGTVSVTGTPHGAEIRVDAADAPVAGTLPAELQLVPGEHVLFLRAPGHQLTEEEVVITPRGSTSARVELPLETGSLVVDAEERGALIEVDGEAMGFTPAVLTDVPAGRHTVRIARTGFRAYEEEVDVAPNARAGISARLRLEQEVAAASRETESLDDVPASVSLVSTEELRAFGYQTVQEAIVGLRGVYVSNDLTYPSIGLRGFSQPTDYGNRLLVAVDGHTMNDDQLGSSYVGYDARADLMDVERVELVRGPGSVLYGTNAFFGVVNLVTRERDTLMSPHVSLATDAQSAGRIRIGGGARASRDVGGWISASGVLSQGSDLQFTDLDPVTTVRGADGFNTGTVALRGWAGDFTLEGSFNRRDHRIPTGAFDTVLGDPRTNAVDSRGFLELRWEPRIERVLAMQVRAFADTYLYEGNFGYEDDDGMGGTIRSVLRDRWNGLWLGGEARAAITATDWLRFTVGAEGRGSALAELTSTYEEEGAPSDRYLDEDPRFFVLAGYAIADVRPVREFRVNAGVRYDYVSTFTDGAFSPRGTIFLRPWEGGTFRLMGGGAFRAPSPYELRYFDGGETQVQAVSLQPERIWTGEVEYTHRIEDVSIVASVFYNYIDNFVTTADRSMDAACTSGDCFAYANADDAAQTMGGEAEIRRDFRQGWMVAGTYSFQRTRFVNLFSDAASARITNSPEHMASIRGVAPLIQDVMSLAARLRVESPRLSRNADGALVESEVPVLLDLVVSGSIPQIHLDYSIGLRNVFDWQYRYPGGEDLSMPFVPQPGRTFFLQTTLWY
jgi:outer membrane receptor protein involved in Fe transport